MKKLILLGAMLCASALNSMEPESNRNIGLKNLPRELHEKIIKIALSENNTLEEAIATIKAASSLEGIEFNSLENFTKLTHILANTFNTNTITVANAFKTLVANKYIALANALTETIRYNDLDTVTTLISQGVDVNYTKDRSKTTPLLSAVIELDPAIVQTLLNAGANPHFISTNMGTPLDHLEWMIRVHKGHETQEIRAIKKTLLRAMQSPESHHIKTGESCEK